MPAVLEKSGHRLLAAPELVEFLEGGVITYVATRSAALEPHSQLGFGIKVETGSDRLTVYVAESQSAATLANLRDNGQIAVSTVKVTDYRSLQLKGEFVSVRPAEEAEQAIQIRYLGLLGAEMGLAGMPRSIGHRMVWTPSLALSVCVREFFVQTPGRRAGHALESAAEFAATPRDRGPA